MEDGDSESREQGPPDECSPLSAESFREEGFPRTTLSTVVATCLFTLKLIKIKHHRDLRSSVAPASSRVPRGDVWLAATLLGSVIALQKLPALAVHWGSGLAGGRGGRAEGTIALCAGEAATPVLGVCPPGEAVPGSVVPSLPGSQAEAQQKPGCLGGVGGCPSGMEGAPVKGAWGPVLPVYCRRAHPHPVRSVLRPWRGSRGKLRLGEVECLVQGRAAGGGGAGA